MARIVLKGGDEMARALKGLGVTIAGRLGLNSTRAGARVIATSARQRAPKVTGALKKSIRTFDAKAQRPDEKTVFAGSNLFYAPMVEFGTIKFGPRSYLRGAVDNDSGKAVDKLATNLGAGIERECARYRGK